MAGEVVLIWPAVLLVLIGIKRILTDSAHGPPFLTAFGIVVLYWLPALAIGAYLLMTRKVNDDQASPNGQQPTE